MLAPIATTCLSLALIIGLCIRDPLVPRELKATAALAWIALGVVGCLRLMYVGEHTAEEVLYLFSVGYVVMCFASTGRPALLMGDLILEHLKEEGKPPSPQLRRSVRRTQWQVIAALFLVIAVVELYPISLDQI